VQGNLVQVEDSRGKEDLASLPLDALEDPRCRLLSVHPEVCMDDKRFFTLLKSPIFQRRVKCVAAVDETHLIKEW